MAVLPQGITYNLQGSARQAGQLHHDLAGPVAQDHPIHVNRDLTQITQRKALPHTGDAICAAQDMAQLALAGVKVDFILRTGATELQ